MKEIKKLNKVCLKSKKGFLVNGVVVDVKYDRIVIYINKNDVDKAYQIQELDELKLEFYTHLGTKIMHSAVISTINTNGCMIVENAPIEQISQKRENVRVVCNIDFTIQKDEKNYECKSENISAGGIAFKYNDDVFNLKDDIIILLSNEYFDKDIKCHATIVKANGAQYALKFEDLAESDLNIIVKFVFKKISEYQSK